MVKIKVYVFAFVFFQNDCSFLFALSHICWACCMVGVKLKERQIPLTTIDINKVGTFTASLSALAITGGKII
jgi:hypothetical protein